MRPAKPDEIIRARTRSEVRRGVLRQVHTFHPFATERLPAGLSALSVSFWLVGGMIDWPNGMTLNLLAVVEKHGLKVLLEIDAICDQ